MPLRRRPLLRAAAIGGGAYLAGKNRGQRQAQEDSGGDGAQQGQAQQGQPQQGQAQPGQAPGQAQPGQAQQGQAQPGQAPGQAQPGQSSTTDQLSRLTALHQDGQLTDAEFAAAKSKLLGI